MRILVVGAGAVGGYFGGRLLAAGRDVTFLVRAQRAATLSQSGLSIRSPHGDLHIQSVPCVTAGSIGTPFDLIVLSCKAYDLSDAIESIAPAVGAQTAILPLLNGMRHIDWLAERFGADTVLGGQCFISSTLDPEGRILHLNALHELAFGELSGARTPRTDAIAAAMSRTGFNARVSDAILQEMWDKWMFIAATAGITCLMRAAIGDITEGGDEHALALLDECAAVAAGQGFPPDDAFLKRSRAMLTERGSDRVASMLRDIERGAPVEADHIFGDFIRRSGKPPHELPLLHIVNAHLKAYEVRRRRQMLTAE